MEQVVMGSEGFSIIEAAQGKSGQSCDRVCRILWTHLCRVPSKMDKIPRGKSACPISYLRAHQGSSESDCFSFINTLTLKWYSSTVFSHFGKIFSISNKITIYIWLNFLYNSFHTCFCRKRYTHCLFNKYALAPPLTEKTWRWVNHSLFILWTAKILPISLSHHLIIPRDMYQNFLNVSFFIPRRVMRRED